MAKAAPLFDTDGCTRWRERAGGELGSVRINQSFCVPKADIAANDYDISINRYKEVVYDEIEHPAPSEILEELAALELDLQQGIGELKVMLK